MIELKTVEVKYVVGAYGFAALVEPTWPTVDGLVLVSMSGGWRVVNVADLLDTREEAVDEYTRRKYQRIIDRDMAQTRREVDRHADDTSAERFGCDIERCFAVDMPTLRADTGDVERAAA